jgi:hypothetical protein
MNKDYMQPVAWLHVGCFYGEELQEWEIEEEDGLCDELNHKYVNKPTTLPLYTHPPANDVRELVEALRRLEEVASDCDIGYMDNALRHARVVLDKWEGK